MQFFIICILYKTYTMLKELENWKPIEGFEGLYEISDWGRVRSVDHYVNYKSNGKRLVKGRILKLCFEGRYLFVCLSKCNKKQNFLIHRLVAKAFIPNPDNLPEVNHKTECKCFNHFSALEWCDRIYNTRYGNGIELRASKLSKTINQYTKTGVFIRQWPSQAEIQRQLGFRQSCISDCCCGKQPTAFGYIWKFNV